MDTKRNRKKPQDYTTSNPTFSFILFFKKINTNTNIFSSLEIKAKKKEKQMPAKHDKAVKKPSLQPDHLLIPNGQLLRGVPVQGRGEYKVPLTTDVHSFAIRKRTKG